MLQCNGTISGALWQTHLLMNPEDLTIGRIFQLLYQVVGGALRSETLKDYGLKKENRNWISVTAPFSPMWSIASVRSWM